MFRLLVAFFLRLQFKETAILYAVWMNSLSTLIGNTTKVVNIFSNILENEATAKMHAKYLHHTYHDLPENAYFCR